jgi:hypothetical protein
MTSTKSAYTVYIYTSISRPALTILQVIDATCERDVKSAVPAATSGSAVLLCAWDATQLESMQSLLAASRGITPAEGTTLRCPVPCTVRAAFHIVQMCQQLASADRMILYVQLQVAIAATAIVLVVSGYL